MNSRRVRCFSRGVQSLGLEMVSGSTETARHKAIRYGCDVIIEQMACLLNSFFFNIFFIYTVTHFVQIAEETV